MTDPFHADPLVTLYLGDCLDVMRELPDASVDAVVTDPPYGLEFMGKEWDRLGVGDGAVIRDPATERGGFQDGNGGNPYSRSRIEYGRRDVRAMQDWHHKWATEAFRVLKPGGYLLAFGGTRTVHRLASAIEDAGFEIRDMLMWIYASGFPKSLNLGNGWGTALKPAHEPIVMARKPLQGTVAGNVARYGTGAINVDGTRIGTDTVKLNNYTDGTFDPKSNLIGVSQAGKEYESRESVGRWPSNILLSDPELFDQPNPYVVGSGASTQNQQTRNSDDYSGEGMFANRRGVEYFGDSGGYSRFFLVPKADRAERERGLAGAPTSNWTDGREKPIDNPRLRMNAQRANVHPTVKPIDLMRHLVRLVTPPGGVVLDPFLGSGTTALAASEEGVKCIGIEREAEYLDIAKGRLMATPMGLGLDSPIVGRRRKVQDGVWTAERGYDKGQDWFNWREDGENPEEAA